MEIDVIEHETEYRRTGQTTKVPDNFLKIHHTYFPHPEINVQYEFSADGNDKFTA